MNLDNTLIFFFSALGAFNSLILSLYFLVLAKPGNRSNYFLGGLLAVLSIRVWKSLFFYFNPELSKIYLQIGLSACFFIGPFLFFYVKSKVSEQTGSNRSFFIQFGALLILTLVVGIMFPYETNYNLWVDYFYRAINYQWLLYILASVYLLKTTFSNLFTKQEKLNYDKVWLLSVFFGISIIWIAYNTASYTSYIVGALSLSFVFYLSGLILYYRRRKEFTVTEKKEKYANVQIEEREANDLLNKITEIITTEELYKDPNLSLPVVAKKLNIRHQLLSQLLNNNLNKSFTQFINEYRIEEAKTLLKEKPHLKVESVAEECGFNSNSTFYSAFKKITNTTPSKYLNR